MQLGGERRNSLLAGTSSRNIDGFLRVRIEVIELDRDNVLRIFLGPLNVTVSLRTDASAHIWHAIRRRPFSVAKKLAEDGRLPRSSAIRQEWSKTVAFKFVPNRHIRQFAQRRVNVYELNQAIALFAILFGAGGPHDERYAGVDFVIRHLTPAVVLAQFPAVIAP